MLILKNIKKDYKVGDGVVEALKGVSLSFRQSEFVSILGPSGCGKTTMLNLIGGLDHYTAGDLIIDDVSTKNYSDRDWDTYRNHRVGFIFQSYNLIPHQTVLENVTLALRISGIDKAERIRRAKEALDKVGLKGQYNKKPNQLSGGQCQRVAIARALVNDPEILLADEPTGALDTVTSVQIMDLIKEIAKECLVIMVTHNPELAETYSTRIIKLLDGEVVSDSNPFNEEESKIEQVAGNEIKFQKTKSGKNKNVSKKSKLGFWSAFRLSARNLMSKFKRTLMVCFAGSIGIIGVAMVLAVSTGVQGYINGMQDDMLSGNPIEIAESSYDFASLMSMSGLELSGDVAKIAIKDGYINVDYIIEYLVKTAKNVSNLKITNDITQDYIDYVYAMPEENYAAIASLYGVNLTNNLYTNYNLNEIGDKEMSISSAVQMYTAMLGTTEYKNMGQYISSVTNNFNQIPNSEEFIMSQYEFLTSEETSKFPTNSNEIVLVVNKDYAVSDILLAQLGYYSQEEFFNVIFKAVEDPNYNEAIWKERFSYDELVGKKFTWYPNDTIFNKTDESSPLAQYNPFTYNAYADENWTTGKELTITGILKPKQGLSYGTLSTGVYYTEALTKEIILNNITSELVQYLLSQNMSEFVSTSYNGINTGITYNYSFVVNGTNYDNLVGLVGTRNQISAMLGAMSGQPMPVQYSLSLRELGGKSLPSEINIYPTNFEFKDSVTEYLDAWNNEGDVVVGDKTITFEERKEIKYNDNLAIIIDLISTLINVITYALIAFTALSLVVSTVMVAIITYVSVIERIKEIGVIRSLGGRKKDVSRLFIAETVIIGGTSGLIGVGVTYLMSFAINMLVGALTGIYTIANLPITSAIIMVLISIGLTLISGVVPARIAAHKDPVEALRSE